MRLLKIVAVFLGVVLVLAGVLSVASGGFALSLYRSYVTPSGYFMSPVQAVGSNGFALTAPNINGQVAGRWESWGLSHAQATVRVIGSSKLPTPIFIGIAKTADVSTYLSGVARDRITGIDLAAVSVQYEHVDGTSLPGPPGDQDFWAAAVSGTGSQTLEWRLRDGDWAVVIMNGDPSPPVAADLQLGARFGVATPLIVGLIAGGVVLLAIGATLVVAGLRRRRPPARQAPICADR